MIKHIIFDLSEVLISGLFGIEKRLAPTLNIDEKIISRQLCEGSFSDLMLGNITEDAFIDEVISKYNWKIEKEVVKKEIRQNLLNEIEGTKEILFKLRGKYDLILVSDHCAEWVEHVIKSHDFLSIFDKIYFSFQIKSTKKSKDALEFVLKENSLVPYECLFIDDSTTNISFAKELGINTIHFKDAECLMQELSKFEINYN